LHYAERASTLDFRLRQNQLLENVREIQDLPKNKRDH